MDDAHGRHPGAGFALPSPRTSLRTALALTLALAFAMPALIGPAGARPAGAAGTTSQPMLFDSPGRVALGIYRPEFPENLSALEEYDALAGYRLPVVSWYALWGGWKSTFSRADLDRVDARGSVPLITWEPWAGKASDPAWSLRRAILSGKNDAYITSWARGLAAYGKPVLLRFAHEMHHQTYPWAVGVNGNTAKDYLAAWRRVHDIFRRNGATNVQWVWNPNTMSGATHSYYSSVYRSVYPGDGYVDWLGLDIYNGAWTGPWRSLAEASPTPPSPPSPPSRCCSVRWVARRRAARRRTGSPGG